MALWVMEKNFSCSSGIAIPMPKKTSTRMKKAAADWNT